jgi:trans-aconitate methyltransferase
MDEVIQKHYSRLAEDYDEFLYYSPKFVRMLTRKMLDMLDLQPDDAFVDLGCGTGMYSIDMLKQVTLENPVIGVDPFEEMLAQIPDDAPITPVAETALAFSERPGEYDKVLIKETIHHVQDKSQFFRNMYERINDDGVMLLVHVPPDVQYPLFQAALDRCLGWHADPDVLVEQLTDTGFSVERDALDVTHRLPKEHYFKMVAGCYMSVLTSFEDDELAKGLIEMEKKYADRDVLEFVDHFDYIVARKN